MANASYTLNPSLPFLASAQRKSSRAVTLLLFACLAIVAGCGSNTQRLQQLQNENDRLLSEYRAQRDQLTQLNERLAVAQSRLAESEKLLARQSPLPTSRLSRLNNEPVSLPQFGRAKERSANSLTNTQSDTSTHSANAGSQAQTNSKVRFHIERGFKHFVRSLLAPDAPRNALGLKKHLERRQLTRNRSAVNADFRCVHFLSPPKIRWPNERDQTCPHQPLEQENVHGVLDRQMQQEPRHNSCNSPPWNP